VYHSPGPFRRCVLGRCDIERSFLWRMIERSYRHYIIIYAYGIAWPHRLITYASRSQEVRVKSTASTSFTIHLELGRIMKLHAPRKHPARHMRVNLWRFVQCKVIVEGLSFCFRLREGSCDRMFFGGTQSNRIGLSTTHQFLICNR